MTVIWKPILLMYIALYPYQIATLFICILCYSNVIHQVKYYGVKHSYYFGSQVSVQEDGNIYVMCAFFDIAYFS